MTEFNFDVVVIGSGPAGNAAAIYLIRSNMKVAIIAGSAIGGQLTMTTEVENFPGFKKPILGVDLMQNMIEQSQNLGVEVVYDQVSSVDFLSSPYKCYTEGGDVYIAKSVLIATGASPKWLGLESEKKYAGFGVSACATCDGSFFKNKDVAIIGGGSSAGTEALHLSQLCKKVYLIHRRDSFRMQDVILDKIKKAKNIEAILNTNILDILGTDNPKHVTGVKIKNIEDGKESIINVDGVFLAIGRSPNTEIFQNCGLELDEAGYIVVKPDSTRTNIKGVYSAGDVSNKKFKQAVIAAGYGAVAALEIEEDN